MFNTLFMKPNVFFQLWPFSKHCGALLNKLLASPPWLIFQSEQCYNRGGYFDTKVFVSRVEVKPVPLVIKMTKKQQKTLDNNRKNQCFIQRKIVSICKLRDLNWLHSRHMPQVSKETRILQQLQTLVPSEEQRRGE